MSRHDAQKVLHSLSLGLSSQHDRLLLLHFPHGDAPRSTMLANKLEAFEGLSRDFRYRVELLSSDPDIAQKEMLGVMVTVQLVREDNSLRHFNGWVFEFRFVRTDGGFCHYEMELGPWMRFLSLRRDNFLFHRATVLSQTRTILGKCREADWRPSLLRLFGDEDPEMNDACQFGESDHNYLHRRWEQRGWHYWYEHRADGHTLVLSDDSYSSEPIDGASPEIPWQAATGSVEDDGIARFSPVRVLSRTQASATSFDFKSPRVQELSAKSPNLQGSVPQLESYDYAGAFGFNDSNDGERQLRRRLEASDAAAKQFEASGNDRFAQPGRWFDFTGPFRDRTSEDTQFLITEVSHEASNNYETTDKTPAVYTNTLKCLRRKIAWRPGEGFNSEHPRIVGLQTAIVVGPGQEEIFTDAYGRIKLRFHWDREGPEKDRATAWVRVATPWAGQRFGMIAIPRVGQEVVVAFLDGNPDRPLVIGSVYNAWHMPPWELPANKTQSGILTRSTPDGAFGDGMRDGMGDANALRFEDRKGAEQLWLHAQRDQLTEVEHDEDKWVGNDRRKTIDRDETSHIQRDRTETVDRNEKITVHGARTEEVDGQENITVHADRIERVDRDETVSVGISQSLDVGSNRNKSVGNSETDRIAKNWTVRTGRLKNETVGLASFEQVGVARVSSIGVAYSLNVGLLMNTLVGMNQSEQVGNDQSIKVGANHTLDVGKRSSIRVGKRMEIEVGEHLVLQAGQTIELTTGAARIVLKSDGGIYLQGNHIELAASAINADADGVDINCGKAQAAPPTPPPEPDPPSPVPGTAGLMSGLQGAADSIKGALGAVQQLSSLIGTAKALANGDPGAIASVAAGALDMASTGASPPEADGVTPATPADPQG